MRELFTIYTKNNLTTLLSCVALVIFNIAGIMSLNFIAYILLAMLIFDINVNDKIKGNWSLLEALPITLEKRYLLKVIFPFLFVVLISIGVEKETSILFILEDGLSEVILTASVLILASILANKLNQYILYILSISFIAFLFSFLPFSKILITLVNLLVSYYILSNYRIQKNKMITLSTIVLLPTLLALYFGKAPLYRSLINYNNPSVSFFSATQLIKLNQDKKAIDYLTNIIMNSSDSKIIGQSIEKMSKNKINISLTYEKWLDIFQFHQKTRIAILNHFENIAIKPQWINHQNLFKFEEAIFKSGHCTYTCSKLAKFIGQSSFPKNTNRIKEYLVDPRINRTKYGVKLALAHGTDQYKSEVIELLGHPDQEVKDFSLDYLTSITNKELKQELKRIKKSFQGKQSKEDLENAKLFFNSNI